MISAGTISAMAVGIAVVLAVPIAAIFYFVRRYTMNLSALLLGLMMYIAFDTILLSSYDSFLLGKASTDIRDLINRTAVTYTLYYAFIHALFYTGGFSVALRMTAHADTGVGTGLAVGLGSGLASAFFGTAYPMINNLIAAFQINRLGVEAFLSGADSTDQRVLLQEAVTQLQAARPFDTLFGSFERLMLFVVLVSTGIIVHLAITHRSHIGFQYAAMVLLFVTYIPPALYSTGVIQNALLLELMLMLSAGVAALFAGLSIKKYGNNPVRY